MRISLDMDLTFRNLKYPCSKHKQEKRKKRKPYASDRVHSIDKKNEKNTKRKKVEVDNQM